MVLLKNNRRWILRLLQMLQTHYYSCPHYTGTLYMTCVNFTLYITTVTVNIVVQVIFTCFRRVFSGLVLLPDAIRHSLGPIWTINAC